MTLVDSGGRAYGAKRDASLEALDRLVSALNLAFCPQGKPANDNRLPWWAVRDARRLGMM